MTTWQVIIAEKEKRFFYHVRIGFKKKKQEIPNRRLTKMWCKVQECRSRLLTDERHEPANQACSWQAGNVRSSHRETWEVTRLRVLHIFFISLHMEQSTMYCRDLFCRDESLHTARTCFVRGSGRRENSHNSKAREAETRRRALDPHTHNSSPHSH